MPNVGTGGVYSGPARLQQAAVAIVSHGFQKAASYSAYKLSEMTAPLQSHSISPKMSPICDRSSRRVIRQGCG